jgi:hypothetical protein
MSSLKEELIKLRGQGGKIAELVNGSIERETALTKKMRARYMPDAVMQQVLDYEKELRDMFSEGRPGMDPCSNTKFKPSTLVETPHGSGHIRGCLKDNTRAVERYIYLVVLDQGIKLELLPGSTSHYCVLSEDKVALRLPRRPGVTL